MTATEIITTFSHRNSPVTYRQGNYAGWNLHDLSRTRYQQFTPSGIPGAGSKEGMVRRSETGFSGVVTMTFSHYPHFYQTLWDGTRELFASKPMVDACLHNRIFVEIGIGNLNPACLQPKLIDLGYGLREIENIRQMIEVFSHGNPCPVSA